ncbi:ABC transporter permease [Fulvivirgaceae bacterium BMA10]|uniref:ABC transporter permease n=1 Tax=Splendidivirga corallicola TaxID=3051826 RepID=A0ABT8KNP9_9BACT|nr:ABC transporter permease [Fulvivirgaceae bacterium BMA10]
MEPSGKYKPPSFAVKALTMFCAERWLDEVLGDLEEQFIDNVTLKGRFRAKWIYCWEVFRFIRPHIFSQKFKQNRIIMTLNHFKISYRNLVRNKVYAFVNLLGLSAGIGSVLLISVYLNNELSYDKFYKDNDRIYRIALERIYPDRTRFFASSPVNLATVLKENYDQVEEVTRFHKLFFSDRVPVTIEEDTYQEPGYRFADADYFKVFSHRFLHGNPETALDAPDKVVLTESIAIKYFGDANALNKTFLIDTTLFKISGVIEDVPPTTHNKFELMGSIHQLGFIRQAIESNSWINPWVYTYVKLKKGVDAAFFESQFDALVEQYGKPDIAQRLGANFDEEGHKFLYFLQGLTDIHLRSNLDVEIDANGDITYIYMLAIIAAIILIISTINFINLSTARSTERAKEVGIRKVMGSHRGSLINQFITESILICFLSALIAVILVYIMLPAFNNLLGKSLSLIMLLEPVSIISFLIFIFLVGITAGIYPAMVLSSLQPSSVLKGSYKTSTKGVWLRNSLIGLQFFISIMMISGSILVHNQMAFFLNKDLGFDKENILVINVTQPLETDYESLKHELRTLDGVSSVGGAFGMPGVFIGSGVFRSADDPELSDMRANIATFDDEFMETLQMDVAEGRGFSPDFNDSLSVMINESGIEALGLKDPIGRKIKVANAATGPGPEFTIVGVAKDYHFRSLHAAISPVVIYNGNQGFTPPTIAVRVKSEHVQNLLEKIEDTWEIHSSQEFDFSFLDQDLQKDYEADLATGFLFDVFTLIAIIMSCIGLFGLATYLVEQRMKEMGIRKVLGASPFNIVASFSKGFVKLISIAFIIGVPVTYVLVDKWLSTFAYHIDISWLSFVIAGVFSIVLVLITISYQSIKIALLNPVNTIRDE